MNFCVTCDAQSRQLNLMKREVDKLIGNGNERIIAAALRSKNEAVRAKNNACKTDAEYSALLSELGISVLEV